ncbi:hypothetical protein CPJCM30710_11720 [Clostridium polyendosporum]|uniref:Uncharacterized protein n=1 Tax=Clostridium polyendosporum TaxID=69208 RepID=A0A919RY48_9CLOT|nr:hypothetical protein [Clostridium polyendosporum]GIM28506.1 hypothetical protein CPJCM30710_11720 [Clostridium polyendosporum]
MKSKHEKVHTKETFKTNGTKSQDQWAQNRNNTTVEKPGINESGIKAKKNGW